MTIVTGHLAEQIEDLLAPLPYDLRFVRQADPLGSADAVRRAAASPPFVVVAADTRFGDGDVARFIGQAHEAGGAIAVRRQAERPEQTRVHVEDGRIVRVNAPDAPGGWTGAPLWWLGPPVAAHLDDELGGPPYELSDVFQSAIDEGVPVSAIQVGRTRDLTSPVDLVRENFPYLR